MQKQGALLQQEELRQMELRRQEELKQQEELRRQEEVQRRLEEQLRWQRQQVREYEQPWSGGTVYSAYRILKLLKGPTFNISTKTLLFWVIIY